MATDTKPMLERLETEKYDRQTCIAAIKGERIPDALGYKLLRLCTIRGIRYHSNFGGELNGLLPEFTRALNARKIMDNNIPEINSSEEEPYCIWHPDVALEDTYRKLVQRYPSMIYQVGRACAVAGYKTLYAELDILPEIHIAEEARDAGSADILLSILSKPLRYKVMDDYNRCIQLERPQLASIDGNTAVRWMLEIKQKFRDIPDPSTADEDDWTFGLFYPDGFDDQMFNITEDMNIDLAATTDEKALQLRPKVDMFGLLTSPLQRDLPTADKDLLIQAAAYYGDLDRYVRLRRPKPVQWEDECCIRGVYHNTMFAVWWSKQTIVQSSLNMAIEARFIMNNVLSRVKEKTFAAPYLIWYPTFATESTYRKLAELRPDMLPQIVRASIVARYKDLFDDLVSSVMPDRALLMEARDSCDRHYEEKLKARLEMLNVAEPPAVQYWKMYNDSDIRRSRNWVAKEFHAPGTECSFESLYNGIQCEASGLELMACLPERWRLPSGDENVMRELDYVSWPPEYAHAL